MRAPDTLAPGAPSARPISRYSDRSLASVVDDGFETQAPGAMSNILSAETPSAPFPQHVATTRIEAAQASAASADPPREPRVQRLLLSLAIAFGDVARSLDYAETMRTLHRLPGDRVALAVAAMLTSYAGFIGREVGSGRETATPTVAPRSAIRATRRAVAASMT